MATIFLILTTDGESPLTDDERVKMERQQETIMNLHSMKQDEKYAFYAK